MTKLETSLLDLLQEDCRLPLDKLAVLTGATIEEVAGAIHEIIEASSQMVFADQDGLERLQEYIDETEEAYGKLTPEEQSILSGSFENLGHASVAVDVLWDSMEQLEETGIGERCSDGYGQIAVCHPLHAIGRSV